MSPVDPFEAIRQLDVSADHSAGRRKSEGITYTPSFLAQAMVELMAPQEHETILEPSCGRGVFVFALVQYWQNKGKTLEWIDRWAQDHLFACDLDAQAVEDLHKLWQEYFTSRRHIPQPINAQFQDGLFGQWSSRQFDVIVGNPPYVRIQNLPEEVRGRIREKYLSCGKGNVDLYYAFIEDALARGRRVCLITPNSWLTNDSAATLRELILPRLDKLIDFQSRLVFAPVRAYTSILLAQSRVDHLIKVRSNLPEEGGEWKAVPRADACWGKKFTPLAQASQSTGRILGDEFEVLSGIATLADSVFLLPTPRVDGKMVYQADALDDNREIEVPIEYAPRLIKITKPGVLDGTGPRILYPYKGKTIVPQGELAEQAPGLLSWLERRRDLLEARDRGKTQGYEAWYAYGRKQGFWQANDEPMILLPTMGNGALAPVLVNGADIGPFLFVSGYVIRPRAGKNADIAALAKYLASEAAWTYVREQGKAWAGKGEYRTIGARALRNMPL